MSMFVDDGTVRGRARAITLEFMSLYDSDLALLDYSEQIDLVFHCQEMVAELRAQWRREAEDSRSNGSGPDRAGPDELEEPFDISF